MLASEGSRASSALAGKVSECSSPCSYSVERYRCPRALPDVLTGSIVFQLDGDFVGQGMVGRSVLTTWITSRLCGYRPTTDCLGVPGDAKA
jgi:hypothetical protein